MNIIESKKTKCPCANTQKHGVHIVYLATVRHKEAEAEKVKKGGVQE